VEAALHGVEVEKVAFHEVGAWDSIADIVGAAAAIAWLEPSAVTSSAPVLGSGVIRTAHGLMPVPAPATTAILRGLPVLSEGQGELTTPTGAAILAAVVTSFGAPPPMRLQAQGFGAGTREFADRPNVLRVMLGETLGQALPPSEPELVCVSANIDDMNPQLAEPLMSALFAAGAIDVWFTPILMKKGRPALEVSALCPPSALTAIETAFFEHSTTLGVRRQRLDRTVLERSLAKVTTAFGEVRVKLAARDGAILGATPEFEDCRRLALRAKVPVRRVVAEASAAAFAFAFQRKRR
jgi:pyridinium-3,5-bisthiocarboxylic acid mononucleotide nickel chelatase